MKLRNVLLQYDLWIVCNDEDNEKEIALGIVQGGEPPSEMVTYTIRTERDLPNRVRDERPLVAATISDEAYRPYEGSTIHQIYERLYTKKAP